MMPNKNIPHPGLILGTAMWGWTVPEKHCFALLDEHYNRGFRQVDGATNYPINKRPEDFRKSENILLEWIGANGIRDLKVMMKIGSVNNMRSPEHNLNKSFLLMNLDDYRFRFGNNLDTLMIHWDNRSDKSLVLESLEALKQARDLGLRIGLSGIRHPEVYAQLNEGFSFNFSIQMKHNLLHSDYQSYQAFHGQNCFIAYGINAGGIKMDTSEYSGVSSFEARGGNTKVRHPIVAPLLKIIKKANSKKGAKAVKNFNHCGMTFAFYSPDISGILLGPSKVAQLKESLDFFEDLKNGSYFDLYTELKHLAENYAGKS